jgi:hypothetical protein
MVSPLVRSLLRAASIPYLAKELRMQTLVDPFELGLKLAPRPQPAAPSSKAGADAERDADKASPKIPRSDSWARVRCWCSED